jgi:hypothetical protein
MALQLLTGQGITYPDDPGALSLSVAFTGATIDATGEKVAIMGSVFIPSRTSKSIRKIHFRFGAVTKAGGSGLTVSLQNLTTASSGPIPDETQDETVAIANADAGFASNAWYTTGALSADRTVNPGDRIAVVIEFDGSGRLGADSVVISGLQLTGGDAKNTLPMVALKTASWALTSLVSPNVIFEFSDGSFGTFAGAYPASAINTHTYKQDTAGADEYALKITLPFACKSDGAFVRIEATAVTGDFDLILYDGTTSIASVSIDGAEIAGFSSRPFRIQWSSEVSLSANTAYRLAVKPTQTTSNVTVRSTDVANANHLTCLQGGPEMCHSTRLDLGAWSDTATRRLLGFGLSISSLDDGAGGSGGIPIARGMHGGMR